jgi:hypothetical protein
VTAVNYSAWDASVWCAYPHDRDLWSGLLTLWHQSDRARPIYSYNTLKNYREGVWYDICCRVAATPADRVEFDCIVNQLLADVEGRDASKPEEVE